MSCHYIVNEQNQHARIRVTLASDGSLAIACQYRREEGWRTWQDCGVTLSPNQTEALRTLLNEGDEGAA